MFRTITTACLLAVAMGAAGCNPVLRSHGYIPTSSAQPQAVETEVDTKASVLSRLGNPSIEGTFNEELESDTWYYISSVRERQAYLKPKTRERSITAITFNDDGLVTQVAEYGIEDGRFVDYNDNETPTRGRELSVLEQIFGSVGRIPAGQIFNDQRDIPGGSGSGR